MGFIEEELVTVREGPPSHDNAQVARLVPDGVIELRCLSGAKGMSVRILGYFAEKNVFVGVAWRFRHQLGHFGSAAWDAAIEEARARWADLFPDDPPLNGVFPDDYLSGAVPAQKL